MEDKVELLEECAKYARCDHYVEITHETFKEHVDVFWACPHGGFSRTRYVFPVKKEN